jgi:hypothetical protein
MGHPERVGWWRRTSNGKGNSGFLRCAAHDETVSSFGRNDGSLFVWKRTGTSNDKSKNELQKKNGWESRRLFAEVDGFYA